MATQTRTPDAPLGADVTDPNLYATDTWRPVFEKMRAEAPVNYCPESPFGPYWSITRHADIQTVEAHPDIFSSSYEHGGITVADLPDANFIAMDRPKHTDQRRVVSPAFGPGEIARMAGAIRQRTGELLDTLPVGAEFDWVDTVSVELTTQMLAILFDFPWEDRRKLTFWSDVGGDIASTFEPAANAIRNGHLADMTHYFDRLFAERKALPPSGDLISMMAHSDAMGNMDFAERTGNLILLIVGGNDTTRNSMSGAVVAFNRYPDQWAALLADPAKAAAAAPEIIRWQTPLAHMRRTCLTETQVGGQTIRAGDKVLMWYISANRDEAVFPDAEAFDISRANARRHLSFGFGVHRCVGARLAEIQIQILIEEMVARRMTAHITGEPELAAQSFVHGYMRLPVTLSRG
jgi:cytochrome P450